MPLLLSCLGQRTTRGGLIIAGHSKVGLENLLLFLTTTLLSQSPSNLHFSLRTHTSSMDSASGVVVEGSANDSAIPIPTPLFSDYVEMAYLGIVLLIGVPINLHVLFKLLKQKEKTATYSVKRGFLILKIHLNISDSLILFINAGGKFGWLLTYEWRAGDGMCRLFKFSSVATLCLSSNIVVCIALDRLRNVMSARHLRRENSVRHPIRNSASTFTVSHFQVFTTKIILLLAWLFAIVSSLPQFFAFQTFDIIQSPPKSWYQCTDIWTVNEYLNSTGARNSLNVFPFTEVTKNFHDLFHLVCILKYLLFFKRLFLFKFMVFYGPLIVMAVCYFIIAVKLTNYSKGNPHGVSRSFFFQYEKISTF